MSPAARTRGGQALGLAVLFAAESALFLAMASRHFAWVYPRWFDQQQYLAEAYGAWQRAARDGFLQGAAQALALGSPQGSLHAFLALLAFEIAGPSRLAALSVNLAAFLALQAATFLAVRRISKSYPLAWASVGLLAALQMPWSGGPASAIDFRLDWMAACAFGVALATAVAGKGFRSTPWSLLFGAAVGAAILVRFLTAVYFGLIYVTLLAWLLSRPGRLARSGRLILSGAAALAVCGPALWRCRHVLYQYYWIGHFTGPERALRDSHLGLLSSAGWIFSNLALSQLGLAMVILAWATATVLGVMGAARNNAAAPSPTVQGPPWSAWIVSGAFLAAPTAVLAFHPEKASQPVSALIVGAVWIIILAWVSLARRVGPASLRWVCAGACAAGLLVFAKAQAREPDSPELDAEHRSINALSDYLYFRAEEAGLPNPRVGVTWVFDGLGANSFDIVGLERHGRPPHFLATLPTGLFETTPEALQRGLTDSDFVCLVTRAPVLWPFDRQMAAQLAQMRQWCDGNLAYSGSIEAVNFAARVYERRSLPHPPGGGVSLAALVTSMAAGAGSARPLPPAAPIMPASLAVLASTQADFHYALAAAYSPVRFGVSDLPPGLSYDAREGEIHGRFPRAGRYTSRVAATNPRGTTVAELTFRVEDSPWFSVLSVPGICTAGVPFDVGFAAYDASGKLDFVDVTDMTALKVLRRIPADPDAKQEWRGTCSVVFKDPGIRKILLRVVRFEPGNGGRYSYIDRLADITVRP